MIEQNVTAQGILQAGIGHMQDRAATYDKPEGERSMAATVAAFNAITGHNLTEEQGWLLMVCLKAVRSQQGAYRGDSYPDGAAYFGLAGEAAYRDRAKPKCAMQNRDPRSPNMIEPAPQATLAERAVAFGYVPFPGEMRPVSGLLDCLMRNGVRMIEQADKIDWFVDENTPMETDVIGWKRTQVGADVAFEGEQRMEPIGQNGNEGLHYKPSWDTAPVVATHLLRERSTGAFVWGLEFLPGSFYGVGVHAPLDMRSWEVIESRPLPSLNI